MESLVGQTLHGKYRIDRLIGRGGMGSVYRAEHVETGRPVAVKTILPGLVTDANAIERFRREARAAGSLRHPNIVDVTDFGVAPVDGGEVAYLVMEHLEGSTLRGLLERTGPLRLEVVVDVVEQIAVALDAAHGLGIVHRDLKPDNIWLVPDPRGGYAVRILDFGIAKLRETGPETPARPRRREEDDDAGRPVAEDLTLTHGGGPGPVAPMTAGSPLTELGATLGTPAYMSPEQCRGEHVDARSDIYSLGVVAWQALAGRRPFEGATLADLVRKQIEETPPRVDEINPSVPRKVGEAIATALAKAPDRRYASAGAMAGSVRVASEGPTVILRRGMALYLERFGAFLRLSARSVTPALAILGVLAVGFASFLLSLGGPGVLSQANRRAATLAGFSLWVVMLVSLFLWAWVTMTHHALFASVIERLRSRPFDDIDLARVLPDLQRRIGLEPSASLVRTAWRLAGCYLEAEMKGPAGEGDLAFQVAFHEGRRPDEVLARCLALSRATKRSYDWIRLFIILGMLLPPAVEAAILYALGSLFRLPPKEAAFLATCGATLLLPVNAVLVDPGISPSLAVLYFRGRQALGEGMPEAPR